MLKPPPSVPRSTIPPASVQEKAWDGPPTVSWLSPTTWPLAFTAAASLEVPPSVPRSIAVTVDPAACASPVEAPTAPVRRAARTTAPKIRIELDSLPLRLGVPERRVEFRVACGVAVADDVATCVDGSGEGEGAA